jgi:hypothetical protein
MSPFDVCLCACLCWLCCVLTVCLFDGVTMLLLVFACTLSLRMLQGVKPSAFDADVELYGANKRSRFD